MKFEPIYPHLSGATDSRQAEELQRYLYQLVDRLELAFNSVESRAIDLGLSSKVSSPSSGYCRVTGGCFFKCEEKHVCVTFNCKLTYSGSAVQVNAKPIPADCRPKRNVYALCAADGGTVARVFVDSSGNVFVESILHAKIVSDVSVSWVDGYIDYMI